MLSLPSSDINNLKKIYQVMVISKLSKTGISVLNLQVLSFGALEVLNFDRSNFKFIALEASLFTRLVYAFR